MRPTTLAATTLAAGAVAMTAAAFAGGGGDDPPARSAASGASDGRAIWTAHGCGSCHTFAPAGSVGEIGPDLGDSLRDKPDEYILEGIIAPDANLAAGYGSTMMPDNYAERIPRPDLDRLVAFIEAGVR